MELKNCPFCGSKAKFGFGKDAFEELVAKNKKACLHIECTNLDCGGNMFVHHDVMDYEVMVEKGIREWNRRVPDA